MASLKDDASQIAKYSPIEGHRFEGEEQCGLHIVVLGDNYRHVECHFDFVALGPFACECEIRARTNIVDSLTVDFYHSVGAPYGNAQIY